MAGSRTHRRHDEPGQPAAELAREEEPGDPRPCREHEHFDEQLHHDAPAAGAQRRPNRELIPSRDGPRVHQDRDIRARRDQKESAQQKDDTGQPAVTVDRRENAGGVRHDARFELCGRSGSGISGNKPTVVTSACAPSSVAPGTRRAKTKTSVLPGRTSPAGLVRSGVQRRWFMGNRNPSGITPTTMCGVSPIWMRCPRTAGSDENP